MRTDWTPLLREFQPRFSEDSELELPSVKPALLPDNSELKMQFAFDHDHYSEPSQEPSQPAIFHLESGWNHFCFLGIR